MENEKTNSLQNIYLIPSNTINGIKFTPREIDIIAFLIRVRSTKKIASFLSISPKTVENHVRNIMEKLECNSRDSIIDFIEKSGGLPFIRQHYSHIFIQEVFKKSLQTISKLIREDYLLCRIIHWHEQAYLINQLQVYLNLAGVNASTETLDYYPSFFQLIKIIKNPPEGNYLIYILSKPAIQKLLNSHKKLPPPSQFYDRVLFLLPEGKNYGKFYENLKGVNFIDLNDQKNEYLFVFEILKKMFPSNNFEKIVSEFKDQYEVLEISTAFNFTKTYPAEEKLKKKENNSGLQISNVLRNSKFSLLSLLLIAGLFGIGFVGFKKYEKSEKNENYPIKKAFTIQSDLILPGDSILLNRSKLLAQINDKFKGKNGIQTVALVGIGGAGKTTLARQYAHSKKTSIVWEINGETKETLQKSFEKLASILSKTVEDQKVLRNILEAKNFSERAEKVIQFVKDKLRLYPNWLLIYDNVVRFSDIQNYFPQDAGTWGQGKVILTTRDSNIQNNKRINYIVPIKTLDQNQRLSLFLNVIGNGDIHQLSSVQKEEAKSFLEAIPPFPLDVSIAAYYLKTTNISYHKYLENLRCYDKDFENMQAILLKEASDYPKTRQNIITLSLQDIISTHKDFKDLLLLISLLNSQDIPKDLLNKYKCNTIVDSFIYHLKKYSLITNEPSPLSISGSLLSIHRSTQEISLRYLIKILNLEKNKKPIQLIANILETYIERIIEREDISNMKLMAVHYESLLNHEYLLVNETRGFIKGELGGIYFYLGDYIKAKDIFEKSLAILNESDQKSYYKIAHILVYLANVYNELDNCEKAKDVFEQSLVIYKNHSPEDHVGIARVLTGLGNVYRRLGSYEKAKDVLEQSFIIYKKDLPENPARVARTLGYLGNVYKKLGHYEKAKDALEQSLTIYKKYSSENHVGIAQSLAYLGSIYRRLGDYEKAKNSFEQSLIIYKKQLPENHSNVGWILGEIGNIYRGLGNYIKAKHLLEKNLMIYEKQFPKNHVRVARVMGYLGNVYKDLGDYEKAKELLGKNLINYEKKYGKDHIETARILREFGQVYLLTNQNEEAKDFLQRALKIFQKTKHPDICFVLEGLAEIDLNKSAYAIEKGDTKIAQNFKKQTLDYLTQALEIAKFYFLKDSTHITRIQDKIKDISK